MLSPSKRNTYSRCEQCHTKPATVQCYSCANGAYKGESVKLCYYCDTRIHGNQSEIHQRDIISIRSARNNNPLTSSLAGNSRFFLSGEKPSTSGSQRLETSASNPETISYTDAMKLLEDNENQFLADFSTFLKALEPHLKPIDGLSLDNDRGKLLEELKGKCQEEAQINIQYKKQMDELKVYSQSH